MSTEQQHTPEPWIVLNDSPPAIRRPNGDNIAPEVCHLADARRIVACVNACAGLSTDVIENIAENIAEIGGVYAIVARAAELLEQRDELAQALAGVLDSLDWHVNKHGSAGMDAARIAEAHAILAKVQS